MTTRYTFLVVLIFISAACPAQDKIYKKDGTVIDAKVNKVNQSTIIYHRHNHPDGPEYTLLKNDVVKIVYENGSGDSFSDFGGRSASQSARGKTHSGNGYFNIFSLIPGAYTVDVNSTFNDPGIGISYERLLDDKGHCGLNIPVLLNFTSRNDFVYNYGYYAPGSDSVKLTGYHSVILAPGIKFYPAPLGYRVRYSLGLSFFALLGKEPLAIYDNSYGTLTPSKGDYSYSMFGIMVGNSVNVSVAKHFYMELGLNGGMPFSENRRRDRNALENFFSPVFQVFLKTGLRF